jgi:hypothetical protein
VHFAKSQGGAGVRDAACELFKVAEDPGERRNLADTEPEKLKELLADRDAYVVDCGIVWSRTATALGHNKEDVQGL